MAAGGSAVLGHRAEDRSVLESSLGRDSAAWLLRAAESRVFSHTQADAGAFGELFSWTALSHVLRYGDLEFPRLRIFKGGECIPFWKYSRKVGGQMRIQHDLLDGFLAEGATLSIRGVETFGFALGALVSELEERVGEAVSANLYASWRSEAGFAPHWDNHDVIVLQLDGSKRWTILGETHGSPVRGYQDHFSCPPKMAQWERSVRRGALLYVPRGTWHAVRGEGAPSLHLTIGVHRRTGADLWQWLGERLMAEEAFRADLPGGDPEALAQRVEVLRTAVRDHLTLETIRTFVHDRRPPPSHYPRLSVEPRDEAHE